MIAATAAYGEGAVGEEEFRPAPWPDDGTASLPPLTVARQRFADAGLPFPPVPADLVDGVVVRGEWLFGTRTDTPGPYNLDWFLDEFLDSAAPEDYLLFGHDGYGFNSYAMHYYLVRGPLALFDQLAWGGVYHDDDLALDLMTAHFAQTDGLIQRLDEARAAGLLAPDQRFVVIMSDFYGSKWAIVNTKDRVGQEDIRWMKEGDGLLTLLSASIAADELVEGNPVHNGSSDSGG